MNLQEKIKGLPSSPGVYLMKDSQGGVIYVGKAVNLKRRVQSYFQNSLRHTPKEEKLVRHLKDFDFILTDTEFEAFLLECKLIKEIKPLYNKKMKSPLSYTYLVIEGLDGYPVITVSSNPSPAKGQMVFGPYAGKNTVEKALQGLKEHLKILCTKPSVHKKACLNHSLGLCLGMCLGGSGLKRYRQAVDKIIGLLKGTDLAVLRELEQKMSAYSGKYDFEKAARCRDCLEAIDYLLHNQKVVGFAEENRNIAVLERLDGNGFKLFLIKGNKVLLCERHQLEETDSAGLNSKLNSKLNSILSSIIKDRILAVFASLPPDTITEVNREELDEAKIIYSYLKNGSHPYIVIPEDCLNPDSQERLTRLCSDFAAQQLFPAIS